MKKQGKVKAIPVTEVTEGMQVLFKDSRGTYVLTVKPDNIEYQEYDVAISYIKSNLDKFKTLVVEYEMKISAGIIGREGSFGKTQLALKYSQWQSTIENGEVDSDKIVEFEILERTGYFGQDNNNIVQYAKIIPQKKRMYSEKEVIDLLSKYFVDAGSKIGLGNDVTNFTKSWIKDNLK